MARLYAGGVAPTGSFNPNQVRYGFARFHVNVSGASATALYWYSTSSGGSAPTKLRLIDTVTGDILAEPAPSAPSAVGWQQVTITTVPLTSGQSYAVCWEVPAGFVNAFENTPPAPDAPLVYEGQTFGAGTLPATPAGDTNAGYGPVDVLVTTGAPPPPPPDPDAPVTNAQLGNALASWFDPTDATRPGSDVKVYPKAIGGVWRVMLDLAARIGEAMPGITQPELYLSQLLLDLWNRPAATSGGATAANVTAAVTAINAHTDAAVTTIDAHTDDVGAALSTIVGTHDTEVKAAITNATDAINGHADAGTDAVILAVQGAQAAIGDGINAHDAGVKAALDTAQAELDARIDGAVAGVGALIDTHDGAVGSKIDGAVETLAGDVITARNVLTGWIDDAVAHFDQQINAHDTDVTAAVAGVTGAVNAHADANVATVTGAIDRHDATVATEIGAATDALATLVNGSTDNVNAVTRQGRDAILGALTTATTTIVGAVTAAQTALAALIIGENGVLQVITAIAAGIAAVAGSVADALTILNFLRGGSASAHQTATADFATSPYLFAAAGDYYDVEIAAWPVRQGAVDFPVGKWLPHLGWAVPVYGDVYGRREPLAFHKQRIVALHGATGLLIYTKAGVTGHARAYSAS